jgi:hypothetical protein
MDDQLSRIEDSLASLRQEFHNHRVAMENRLVTLETKSGLYGMVGGAFVTLIAAIVAYLKGL